MARVRPVPLGSISVQNELFDWLMIVYQGGESFDDVIQVELEFLHRHAKKAD